MKLKTLFPLCFARSVALAAELLVQAVDSVIFPTKNTNNNQMHYAVRVDDSC